MDLLDSLRELTQRVSKSRAALDHAIARGREIRDGTDESGTVTILIDDEGRARDVRVAKDWRHRLAPARLGEAVVAADSEAATRRASATVAALAEEAAPSSTQDSPTPPEGRRRTLEELSAAAWAAFDDLDRVTSPPAPVCGSGAQGAVRVTMAQGRITGCVVSEVWLAQQDEVTLAHALRQAVSAAATAAISTQAPFMDYQQRLHEIIADAHATLGQLRPGPR